MNTVLAGLGLTKKYGSTTALDGVDVEVRERDSLAPAVVSFASAPILQRSLKHHLKP